MTDIYQALAREIIVSVRGAMRQTELSQKLGYSFNQSGKWEAGSTLIAWEDFTHVCEVLSIPWLKHTREIFAFHYDESSSEVHIFELMSRFLGEASVAELSLHLNKSRSSIQRLLREKVKVDFADVLRMMDIRPYVLQSWLTRFVNLDSLPSFREKFEAEAKLFRSLVMIPWSPLVNAALGLAEYAASPVHSSKIIARQTALTIDQVDEALEKLVETGAAKIVDGKYIGLFREISMLRVPEIRGLTHFMTRQFAERFQVGAAQKPNPANPSLSSVRVYPLSSEAGRQIANALIKFHHEVAQIAKSDTGPKDHVRTMVIHSVDLGMFAEEEQTTEVVIERVREHLLRTKEPPEAVR